MEMHQIRYFLALSSELNFTRAAKRCGVSQPYLRQIAQTVDDARKTAQTLAGVARPTPTILSSLQESGSP